MNIFLPYEDNVQESAKSLDDKRLNKQILETYQLLSNSLAEREGKEIKGYKKHPIYVHYKKDLYFLSIYGYKCCEEYEYRFGKRHKLYSYFYYIKPVAMAYWVFEKMKRNEPYDTFNYTPFYMEGSKGQPNYIRTTENVSELYQKKLIDKWQKDYENGRPPKWTKREKPIFYKGEEQ